MACFLRNLGAIGIALMTTLLFGTSPAEASTQGVFTKSASLCVKLTTSEGRVVPLCDEPYLVCEPANDDKLRCATFPGIIIGRALDEQLKGAP